MTETAAALRHAAVFYRDGDDFLDRVVPCLRDAVAAGEPAIAAVGPQRGGELRGALGADASAVELVDMRELGRNPARIIPFLRQRLEARGGPLAALRAVAEPVWSGRRPEELEECWRHERLLDIAFADAPRVSLLCAYDAGRLDDAVLSAARACHSSDLPAPEVFAGKLPPRPASSAAFEFDLGGLAEVRSRVLAQAEQMGLGETAAWDLVTAVAELAGNSVAHGGGSGTAWIWSEGADMVVEVGDAGTIEEPLVGRRKPDPRADSGRGLWIANALCDLVQIRSAAGETAVRVRMAS